MFGVPRSICHWYYALGYIVVGYYYIYNMSFKTIAGGFNGAF